MRTRYPNIIQMTPEWHKNLAQVSRKIADGRYVPSRPLGWQSWTMRFTAAWLVFRGKADALLWEGQ